MKKDKKLQSELTNIKNDIFRHFKNSKMTPKTPKNQQFKIFQNTCKEASNEKSVVNKLQLELKNIKKYIQNEKKN